MKSDTDRSSRRVQNSQHIQGKGPNWVFIVGGALLSTLSIRIGFKLKQAFDGKRSSDVKNVSTGPENALRPQNGKSSVKKRQFSCPHMSLYCFDQDADSCYHCLAGMSEGISELRQPPTSPMSKSSHDSLPLVKIPMTESAKENGCPLWVSSPDCLEPPPKPFHYSNSSGSPCVSESGSDVYSKREVIQKLRQQLKRRDEMIMEMQSQITDLQNSLTSQISHSSHLQSQMDSANREIFDSEREIQRLRKTIADHCIADSGSPDNSASAPHWNPDMNGHANGFVNKSADLELHADNIGRSRDGERVQMLKKEVQELKEVIEGKEFLLQSYREQKVELHAKVQELQARLAPQVPNIL